MGRSTMHDDNMETDARGDFAFEVDMGRIEIESAVIYTDERYYTPFVDTKGRVGYRVTSMGIDGEESFLYFNPSNGPTDRDVFIYIGENERPDPNEDGAVCFIDVGRDWQGLSDEQKDLG